MGNSGSMNGLPGYDEAYHPTTGYHHHHHHQQQQHQHQYQRYHELMRSGHHGAPPGWLESYQRDLRNGSGGAHRTFDNRHTHDSGHRESTSSGPSLPPPMKVLPDIPGRVAKLRPTNNGNILHAGGTISKNNNLQRSKSISSPTYQQHQQQQQHHSFDEEEESGVMNSLPPQMMMTRSRTQINMMSPGRRDFDDSSPRGNASPRRSRGHASNQRKPGYEPGSLNNNKKHFGSEPDLRISISSNEAHEDSSGGGGGGGSGGAGSSGQRNTKPVQSKIIKNKNKKKAPVPPPLEKREEDLIEKQRIIAYSPLRKTNSDASSTLPSSDSNSNNPARKLRLFKTRAETKKNHNITKLPEASDAKYSAKNGPIQHPSPSNGPTGNSSNSSSNTYKPRSQVRKDPDFDTGTLDKPSKSRLNPTSFFRREKTFDLGVLERDRTQRDSAVNHVPNSKPTMSPPISRRKSIVKTLLEKDQAQQQAQQQQARIAAVEPKVKSRRQDEKQKPPTAAMTDFQKELQLATRRKTPLPSASSIKPTPQQTASKTSSNARKISETKQTIKIEPSKGSLVISMEPKDNNTERENGCVSPPPPPPPLPKTSFYFGMSAPSDSLRREPKISPNLLAKAKMIETCRLNSERDNSDDEQPPHMMRSNRNEVGHEESEMDRTQLDAIDRFAASLMNGTKFASGSDSAASSDVDMRTNSGDVNSEHHEISLKLRPTLPRKQFEIPRFSPAAAWRLLTTEDDFGRDSTELFPFAEKKQLMRALDGVEAAEDRIERIYREPIPGLQDNKSGDSGISGDAGLPDIGEAPMLGSSKERDSPESSPVDESPSNVWSSNAIRLTPWTPQQDLEDDDDTTGSSDNRQLIEDGPLSNGTNDFSTKGHLFSLSLPRENHLSIYTGSGSGDKVEKHMFNSLQKLRKSVSDAFTTDADVSPLESGDNWFLSRLESTASITNNAYEKRQLSPTAPKHAPPEAPSSGTKNDDSQPAKPSKHSAIGYLVSGKHMMYLPKEPTRIITNGKNDQNNNNVPDVTPTVKSSNAASEKRKEDKENMQDPIRDEGENFPVKISHRKNHRFTFQSTIRQIEKRRVAEKLSREAEIKEAMRLSELEAMRRVEEEFQKKRAREKASIRHQLRLFSMEETDQPYDGNDEEEVMDSNRRAEQESGSPHQTKTNGMYRKKESTLERSTLLGGQSRRLSQSRGFQGATTSLERKFSSGSAPGNYNHNDHLQLQQLQLPQEEDFNSDDNMNHHINDDDDDDEDSSLSYIDTRTPYISRIIQAKSSKSYSNGLKK
ncbi:uncharacterized protein LOC129770110 [Toxorhynchites rutilus septentrionalis]|uniref:uncharacterized protein LOC129770110 n=1 Tax=Toxorhynchites rutilus septentrionalis TaxID=329112 RepID=UPI00247B0665|nr:uncharacterized protein LOC129770110 [Toxorhynchites rutilus septentrionalis]XP_055628732.1 uncharacterized protein LOC129770110 [Toxorhynchites rutilus septentrionalis]